MQEIGQRIFDGLSDYVIEDEIFGTISENSQYCFDSSGHSAPIFFLADWSNEDTFNYPQPVPDTVGWYQGDYAIRSLVDKLMLNDTVQLTKITFDKD